MKIFAVKITIYIIAEMRFAYTRIIYYFHNLLTDLSTDTLHVIAQSHYEFRESSWSEIHTLFKGANNILTPFSTFSCCLDIIRYRECPQHVTD
jgi:hypothetical protein